MVLPAKEYNEDDLQTYEPIHWSIKEIRGAIPEQLFARNTARSMIYFSRDFIMAAMCFYIATYIDPFFESTHATKLFTSAGAQVMRYAAWATYWWFQGLIFTGIWIIGHECGHGNFSDITLVNHIVGFLTHTFLLTPYHSWRISHHRHHSHHNSMERDEIHVPQTRADIGIPDSKVDNTVDSDDIFSDTPIYMLALLVRQQLIAYPAYLLFNVTGQKTYPRWTNHFNPSSALFTREQRNAVIMSDIGVIAMLWATNRFCSIYSTISVVKHYLIPWLVLTHWLVMITFLQHTDPVVPHYRGKAWNFPRGAASTIDRPFLGWQGRFFLHDVCHYHVVHHFFPKMPFYNGYEATQHLKAFIGDSYISDDTPVFKALWKNYNACLFVDNEGDVLFYRDKKGQAQRRPPAKYRQDISEDN